MAPVDFSNLAYEITSLIFQHACSINPHSRSEPTFYTWGKVYSVDRTPIVLSSVCMYWRRVACQTPELWRVLTIEVRTNMLGCRYALLLRLYMERVRHLGFSLGIRLQRGCRHSASDVEPIANVLFDPKHASQISILRLSCIPAGWMPMLSRLSHMHTLHLSQCPNPIEFCTPFSSSLESPVTLTHIEALELDIRVGLLEDSSPQHLKFPSLKTLCIQAAERPNLPDSLIIFCHRLSAALITLELMEFITCGDEFSRRLFCSGKLLKLETLKLIECDTFNLTSVVRALTPGEDHLNPKPLPSLRQLVLIPQPVVENGSEELEEFEAKSRGIVERALLLPLLHMLQKRGDGIHSRLRVQIPRLDFHCVPAARYGFYQLLKERRIEIYSTASRFNLGRQYSTDLELI